MTHKLWVIVGSERFESVFATFFVCLLEPVIVGLSLFLSFWAGFWPLVVGFPKNTVLKLTCSLGRQKCDCQAQKHDLVNNCLACGRIVCEQEGEGPCLFCGEMVLYPDVAYISDENLKKALARKDMLLDFDRNSSKRTEVVDDETDYYRYF